MNSNIRDFIKAIQNANKTATSAYDTAARVTRVEGSTAWVHVEGGVEETPVEMSISCEPGDDVRVRINKGAAYIIGNNTNPPTNDRIIVKYAADLAQAAREVANRAYANLQEILSTYVTRGSSNISSLSSAMTQTENGTNVYGDIDTAGNNYLHVDESGLDIKTITVNGELNDTVTSTKNLIGGIYPHMHFGRDYILYGQTWQTTEASIGERAVGFGNVRPNSKYAFAAGNTATVQGSDYGAAFNSGLVQDSPYGFAANDGSACGGYYSAAFNNAYADGQSSFATGSSGNFAKATYSAVFGDQTVAEGKSSIAEGYGFNRTNANTAKGIASHVSGYMTKTESDGDYSFVMGMFNTSNYVGQTIVGRANVNKADTIFEVGNGKVRYNQTYAGYPLYDKLSNSNGFEVTEDGYIRTGVGMEKIGFGKESNVYGYFIPPDLTLPQVFGYYYNTKFYEEPEHLTEITGESGKLYKDQTDGATILLYRWENNEFIDADTPVFIAWGSGGGGSYTAGDGIDISATNEISVNNDIARTADIPTIPTNVSAFTNDVGYLTQHQDLSNYIQKSLTAGLVKNDGTIDTTAYLPLSGGTMVGPINSQHIVPATDDSYRLGSSSSKYNSAYIKRIYNLASIESTTDGSKRLLVPAKSGTIAVNEDLPNVVGNLIAVNPFLTSGTLIANVTISGVSKNIYSPVPDWAQTVSTEPDYIKNKPAIPSHTSDLTNDSGFVTDSDVASALAGKQDALTAGAGLAISNAIVKTNITANDDWQDTAYEKGAGVFAHKYENANTTTYNLPSGYCFVIVYRYSANRGVAYATYWASGGGSPKTWVNALHDDTAPYTWTGWKQMYTPETIGGATIPTYLNAGVPTACSAYAGGTNVTLNGSNKGASTASFYAPTSVGTSGYFLKSNGSGAPTWAAVPSGGGITISEIYPSDTEYKVPLVDNPYFDCVLPVNNNITSVGGLVTYISNYGFIPIRNRGYYQGSVESYGYGKPAVELLGTDKNQNGIVLQGQGFVGFGIGSITGNWPGWYIFVLSFYNTFRK